MLRTPTTLSGRGFHPDCNYDYFLCPLFMGISRAGLVVHQAEPRCHANITSPAPVSNHGRQPYSGWQLAIPFT